MDVVIQALVRGARIRNYAAMPLRDLEWTGRVAETGSVAAVTGRLRSRNGCGVAAWPGRLHRPHAGVSGRRRVDDRAILGHGDCAALLAEARRPDVAPNRVLVLVEVDRQVRLE